MVLVDDIEEYRRVVRIALRVRSGFEVVGEAADGASAVQVVAETRPDVIVLDLGLPDLSGRELIPLIRAASPESGLVVFTGTYVDDRLGVRPLVEAYVLKDVDVELLVQVLADVGATADSRSPVVLDLPADMRSSRDARQFVRGHCASWDLDGLADDAALVVTELVSNAIVHGGTGCQVHLQRSGAGVRIEVTDGGTGSPDIRAADGDDEHGRGLLLVSRLTGAWGVDATPAGGKRVWGVLVAAEAGQPAGWTT